MKRSYYLLFGIRLLIGVSILVLLVRYGRQLLIGSFSPPALPLQVAYPPAPAMPPVVDKPIAEILTRLEEVLKVKSPETLELLQAGLSDEEIARIEQQAGVKFPEDMKAVYRWHNGCRVSAPFESGPIPGDRFLPLEEAVSRSQALAKDIAKNTPRYMKNDLAYRDSWIHLFDDGSGDGYFYDPNRKDSEGAILYNFMEDGSYIYFPSIKNLVAGALKCWEQDAFQWHKNHDLGRDRGAVLREVEREQKIWQEFGASPRRES